jgi:hypothetical protein
MDEVDFTILAATSVLGDLIEKCPPAEACRDAFERMSRATVQMCGTSGLGSQATGRGLSSQGPSQRGVPYASMGSARDQSSYGDSPGTDWSQMDTSGTSDTQLGSDTQQSTGMSQRMTELRGARKAQHRFDMNLRDLFPESLDSGADTFGQGGMASQTSRDREMDSQRDGLTSPPLSRPNLLRQQSQSNIDPSLPSGNNQPMSQAQSQSQGGPYMTSASQFTQPFESQFNRMGESFRGTQGEYGGSQSQYDFEPINGFGMGLDLGIEHDWADGSQGYDLFDGFFFGGAGT